MLDELIALSKGFAKVVVVVEPERNEVHVRAVDNEGGKVVDKTVPVDRPGRIEDILKVGRATERLTQARKAGKTPK